MERVDYTVNIVGIGISRSKLKHMTEYYQKYENKFDIIKSVKSLLYHKLIPFYILPLC